MALNQPRPINSDDAVAHLDRAHQHQHIEDQLTHIVPYDGGCRQRIVRNGGRGRGWWQTSCRTTPITKNSTNSAYPTAF